MNRINVIRAIDRPSPLWVDSCKIQGELSSRSLIGIYGSARFFCLPHSDSPGWKSQTS